MKTAVSIPDPVFAEAEILAKRLGITRSKLYANALGAFVASHAPDSITDAMNAALDAAGSNADRFSKDRFSQEGARRVFGRNEW